MAPTRNNLGQFHENGVVECANGALKKRLAQQLLLRGHSDFESIATYQAFIDRVVSKLNQRNRSRVLEEQAALQPLPEFTAAEYQTLHTQFDHRSQTGCLHGAIAPDWRIDTNATTSRQAGAVRRSAAGIDLNACPSQAWGKSRPQRQLPSRYSCTGLKAASLLLLSVA
ncbi:hypothetical protein [Vreelandella salicampi]|uniref:hypothetical protein n=1 Tax=Vreelandella salicampi TaxID=1449798 RepID=UPI0019D506E4|nr:hypothetical protein [Halomonas salicampi]